MYTIRIRLIAYILLISHGLSSCYNPDVVNPEWLSKHHQETAQTEILPDSLEEERQPAVLILEKHTASRASGLGEEAPSSLKNRSSTSIYPSPTHQKSALQKTEKKALSSKNHLGLVLLNPEESLSISPSIVKKEDNQEDDSPRKQAALDQLAPIFITQKGVKIQFVPTLPADTIDNSRKIVARPLQVEASQKLAGHHRQQAIVEDPFGMRYELPVRYENNTPLPLEELTQKGTYPDWCTSNLHLLDVQGEKCVYVGKMGLMGGGRKRAGCPYRAKASEGSGIFTTTNCGGNTHSVEFVPCHESNSSYWKAYVRHAGHYLSDNSNNKRHWGWVYSNYSQLSEEELRACHKSVVYDCPFFRFGGIKDVKYVLTYLNSSDRARLQRERETRRRREEERIKREQRQREEEFQKIIREGESLEEEIKQFLNQELARNISDDEKTEALIRHLRKEAAVLRAKQAPEHLIEELEKLIEQEVISLQQRNQQARNQSQAGLWVRIIDLRDAQSTREDAVRRQVAERLLAIRREAHEAEKQKWEEENRRKTAAEMKRLEALRREAEKDRERAAKRKQEDTYVK